jgi:hypothetical protein
VHLPPLAVGQTPPPTAPPCRSRGVSNEVELLAVVRGALRKEFELVRVEDPDAATWRTVAQLAFRAVVRAPPGRVPAPITVRPRQAPWYTEQP